MVMMKLLWFLATSTFRFICKSNGRITIQHYHPTYGQSFTYTLLELKIKQK